MTQTRESARVIPVLDIMNGAAVRAVAGRRCEYAPLKSPLLDSPDPLHFVERISSKFGFDEFYVADIDAVLGKGSNWGVMEGLLSRTTFKYLFDGGFKTRDDIPDMPSLTPVIGTETFEEWGGPGSLSGAIVSVDTFRGELLSPKFWLTVEPVLAAARDAGARRFIHLRLDAVGRGLFDPEELLTPGEGEEWIAAGGIRDRADLETLADYGYSAALVSTAIHDGRLP